MSKFKTSLVCRAIFILLALGANIVLGDDEKQSNPPKFTDPVKNIKKLVEILKDQYYDEKISEEELYRYAAQGILDGLRNKRGPTSSHDKIVGPSEEREWDQNPKEEFAGIGVEIEPDKKTGFVRVLRVLPDGAADVGGLQRGDKIVQIGGKSVRNLPLEKVTDEIRGRVGQVLHLELIREKQKLVKALVRKRLVVRRYRLESFLFDKKIGYLRVDEFQEDTSEAVKNIAGEFAKNKIDKLIIDLRNCSGGNLTKVVDSAGIFLPPNSIVTRHVSRGNEDEFEKTSEAGPTLKPAKAIILMSKHTAAGCELFAASLRENISATLVGEPTEGWVDLQRDEKLPNGFTVLFTNSILKTGKGEDIRGKGLKPDVLIKNQGYLFDPDNKKTPLKQQISEDPVLAKALKSF